MQRERDTSQIRHRLLGEPSQPTAPEVGGAATPPVRSAPPGPWLPSDNFIYRPRWYLDRIPGYETTGIHDTIRMASFERRLEFQYGERLASEIMFGEDGETLSDVSAWERLGA